MLIRTRFFLSLILLTAFSAVSAQEQIERLFRSERQNTAIDVAQTSDQGYLFLSAGRPLDSMRFEFYTVSKFDNKGNFVWSKDYSFEQKVIPDGSLTLLESDSFVISGILDTSSVNKILLKGSPTGDVAWTRGFGRDDDVMVTIPGDASVDPSHQGGFFIAGDAYNDMTTAQDIYLAQTDSLGGLLWGKTFNRDVASPFNTTKVKMTQDSGAIVTGWNFNGTSLDMFLVKTDSLGNIEWSREYGEDNLDEIATAVAPTPDGGYLIGARKINPALPSHPGFLIKTDTFGNPQWVRNVDFLTSDTVLVNNIVITSDGEAVVSGSLLGITPIDNFAFMMKIDMNGDISWKRRYKAATRQFTLANGLAEAAGGGYIYLTTSDDSITQEQIGPYLIKTDMDGQTICDSIIDGQLAFPTTVTVDTLVLLSNDVSDTRDVTVVDTLNYNGFNLVTLSLETFGPYCPDEVFSDTLDATTEGAIAYEWSTDETTPMIVVTEPGEYMVTVTIGVDYCYQLCASSTIGELPLPMVELSFDDANFCSFGTVQVIAQASAADNIEWSSGESNVNQITVDSEQTYSVTVSNTCGTETASIPITFDTSPPEVNITLSNTFCASRQETLNAATTPFDADGFLWSTGDGTSSISVDALGTYSVTALSNFCEDGTASISVDPVQIEVSLDGDGTFCDDGNELLTAAPSSVPTTYEWSTGEDSENITVTELNTYSLTVSDFCGSASASIDVDPVPIEVNIQGDETFCEDGDELLTAIASSTPVNINWSNGDNTPVTTITEQGTYTLSVTGFCDTDSASIDILCPIVYKIPNVFTPNGDDVSDEFIPLFGFDPSELVEYEFIVYSRWGEVVFETTSPFEGWDGMVNDSPGVSDVYIYTVKGVNNLGVELTNEDIDKENHGDVTLLR